MSELPENDGHPRFTRDLIGHAAAERTFLEAFNADRLHHGWLITGPKGIGKATLAWKIAKFLLTQQNDASSESGLFGGDLPQEAQTLNVSESNPDLQRIEAGGHGGLLPIERSLNTTTGKIRSDIVVDDIRKVTRFFSQTSSEGGWRVAIIDAADEMNNNAANALLKILEEPPEKSIILLVAHSPGRLLPTVRSRCRVLGLKTLTPDSVKAVVAARFPALDTPSLIKSAALADGAPGRAVELVSTGGTKLYDTMLALLDPLPRTNIPAVHAFADQMAAAKADAEYRLFIQIFTEWLQRLIRTATTGEAPSSSFEHENQLNMRLSALSRLDQWLDLWEKVLDLVRRADAVNLDKKQVILNMFATLSHVTRT